MFTDEFEYTPPIDEEEFKKVANTFLEKTGEEWTEEEAEKIYEWLEEAYFRLSCWKLAVEGAVVVSWIDGQIVFSTTEEGNYRARDFQRKKDAESIDNLLDSLDN